MLRDNLDRRGSVMPLSRGRAVGWAEGLGIPRGGNTVLYTGLMYQLMPSMIALEKLLSRFEESALTHLFGVGRAANRVLNMSRFAPLLTRREDQETFDGILRDIVLLLRDANVDFGYLYEEELYAGALAHDEGLCGAFEKHAVRVRDLLRNRGVKRVITVDPHTTHVLRTVYPKVLGENRLEVRSYLEVLAEDSRKAQRPLETSVAIHDSCVYARHEDVIQEPRRLLSDAGLEALEPENSGKMTFCCGGPIESLFPSKARSIAATRVDQLASASPSVVTSCPICLVNLEAAARRRGVSVHDISGYLARATIT
jgi:Fe-S oxidoreductase